MINERRGNRNIGKVHSLKDNLVKKQRRGILNTVDITNMGSNSEIRVSNNGGDINVGSVNSVGKGAKISIGL